MSITNVTTKKFNWSPQLILFQIFVCDMVRPRQARNLVGNALKPALSNKTPPMLAINLCNLPGDEEPRERGVGVILNEALNREVVVQASSQ